MRRPEKEQTEHLVVLKHKNPELIDMESRRQQIARELRTVEQAIRAYLKSQPSAEPLLQSARSVTAAY